MGTSAHASFLHRWQPLTNEISSSLDRQVTMSRRHRPKQSRRTNATIKAQSTGIGPDPGRTAFLSRRRGLKEADPADGQLDSQALLFLYLDSEVQKIPEFSREQAC